MLIPQFIQVLQIAGKPIKHKWSDDIAGDIDDTENVRLYRAIDLSSFRAKMAIGAFLAELTVWRFHGLLDISDGLLRVEAAWSAVIDPEYVNDLDFEVMSDHDTQPVEAAYQSALYYLGETSADYFGKNIFLAEAVTKQAALARHVFPDKKQFDLLLTEILRRIAADFPRTTEYDEETELYDASAESPIPRAYFDRSFTCNSANLKGGVSDFLRGLDFKHNPYLRSPEQMAQHGFVGVAYQF